MKEQNPQYLQLKEKIKRENLSADTKNPGEFIQSPEQGDHIHYLYPENWVFHQQVVDHVLKGTYDEIKPYSAEFVTTLNCSNRCDICAYKCPKQGEFVWLMNNFSDPEVHMQSYGFAKDLLEKLIQQGIKGMIFTGGGEPFLFKNLEGLVALSTEKGVDSVVYTNGNHISESRIKALVEAAPLLVRVSLNAGTKPVYDTFHNPFHENAFERCLATIESLAKYTQEIKNSRTSIGVGVVITEQNKDNLIESAKRIREIVDRTKGGIEFITYRPAFEYYDSEQLGKSLLEQTHEIVETDVRKVLEGTGVHVSNVSCRYDALMQNTRNYTVCRGSGLYAELAPNGNLYFCCDRNLNRRCIIGDLKQDSLLDIHLGKKRTDFLDFLKRNKCRVCPPACKSHELNKQFQKIEDLRQSGELYKAELWIEELQKLPPPKMVNF